MTKYSEIKDPNYWNSDLSVNNSYSGSTATMLVYSNAKGMFAPLVWTVNGFVEACSGDSSTMPCDALALQTGTGEKKVFLNGFIRNNAWSFTRGPVYVSTVTGELTQTAPTDATVQIVGYAYSSNVLKFAPDLTTATLVASKVDRVMGFALSVSGTSSPEEGPVEGEWYHEYFDDEDFEAAGTDTAEWDGTSWVPTDTNEYTIDISPKTSWNQDFRPDYIKFGFENDPQDIQVTIFDTNTATTISGILTASGIEVATGHIWATAENPPRTDLGIFHFVSEEKSWKINSIGFLVTSSGFNWNEIYNESYFEPYPTPLMAVWDSETSTWYPYSNVPYEILLTAINSWKTDYRPNEVRICIVNDPGDLKLTIMDVDGDRIISELPFTGGMPITLKGLWGFGYTDFDTFKVSSTSQNTSWGISSIEFLPNNLNRCYATSMSISCVIYGPGGEIIFANYPHIYSGVEYNFKSTLGGGEGTGYMLDNLTFDTKPYYEYNDDRTLTITKIEFFNGSTWDDRTLDSYYQNLVGISYSDPNWTATIVPAGSLIGMDVSPAAGGEGAWTTDYYPTKFRITFTITRVAGGEGG